MTNLKETSINEHGALVGDILCDAWGYDQTNYDFYKVIKATKKTIVLEKMNGYNAGEVFKNKRTRCERLDGSAYSVSISDYCCATCDLNDRKAVQNFKLADEEANDPYCGH